MAAKTTSAGKYLYAVVQASGDRDYGEIGIDGARVYLISDEHVAAVVSDFTAGKIRPERRHIAAHQAVLKRVLADESLLPISFGIIAEGSKEIRRILTLNRKPFVKQIQRVFGKVEMGLRVSWDVPNIFEYFVNTHAELRVARDQLLGGNGSPSREDQVEVGRLFDRLLQYEREELTQKVEACLKGCCVEIKRNPPRNEKDVMNLACLVTRQSGEKDFEAAICVAAQGFDNNFSFDFNGPWAPHNFVDVELVLE
ncbi:MAG: GvpL/GvpF family gas vesicle protein [bacterium]